MMGDPAWFRARARASRYARYLALKTALSVRTQIDRRLDVTPGIISCPRRGQGSGGEGGRDPRCGGA
jgi:hypothetical protein